MLEKYKWEGNDVVLLPMFRSTSLIRIPRISQYRTDTIQLLLMTNSSLRDQEKVNTVYKAFDKLIAVGDRIWYLKITLNFKKLNGKLKNFKMLY